MNQYQCAIKAIHGFDRLSAGQKRGSTPQGKLCGNLRSCPAWRALARSAGRPPGSPANLLAGVDTWPAYRLALKLLVGTPSWYKVHGMLSTQDQGHTAFPVSPAPQSTAINHDFALNARRGPTLGPAWFGYGLVGIADKNYLRVAASPSPGSSGATPRGKRSRRTGLGPAPGPVPWPAPPPPRRPGRGRLPAGPS